MTDKFNFERMNAKSKRAYFVDKILFAMAL